ncbi:U3 small nucleolar RNA-associated protein 6 homolog isoform X2 [Rhodnius prolixus]|uniref:U3 small nucleolar RNA-associated protein 6 homolog isoform X2 n=1 Tax=Rhodnius prolixus TaxID=13249 RepID=UPI003D18A887
MAEYVEQNIEAMIPELELMEKMQLFDKNEIRAITKKRKEFEYKMQRVTKCKEDIMRYIQYEMDLMKLIRQKRVEKGLNNKKNNVDYAIANHINKLFNQAIRRFPSDVRIWLSYIKFCKQVRFYTCASRILDQMLELHGSAKPELYKLAAQWEFEECQCVEKARKFLLNGLHIHKDSKLLYKEAFKLELNYANSMRKELGKEEIPKNDPLLEGKLAEVMYESAVKKITDINFVVELHSLTKEYTFTEGLQEKILNDLKDRFPKDELTWDTLAKRELFASSSKVNSDDSPLSQKDKIMNCEKVYEEACESVPTQRMWNMYLDTVVQLNQDQTVLPNYKKNLFQRAFKEAHKRSMLDEKYYLIWVDHLEGPKLYNTLKEGTKRLPQSVRLWEARLKFLLSKGEEAAGVKVFNDALATLVSHEHALPLWKYMLKYWQITNPSKAESLFKEGIAADPAVSTPLKPLYLEWLTVNHGIVAARKVYSSLANMPPYCLEMHFKMAQLEDVQPQLSLKNIRKCHIFTTQQFGQTNTDVWMAYVKFEQKHGEPKNVSEIYSRAIKVLKPHLVDIFVSEFSLSKAECFTSPIPARKIEVEEPMET